MYVLFKTSLILYKACSSPKTYTKQLKRGGLVTLTFGCVFKYRNSQNVMDVLFHVGTIYRNNKSQNS